MGATPGPHRGVATVTGAFRAVRPEDLLSGGGVIKAGKVRFQHAMPVLCNCLAPNDLNNPITVHAE
jgi:hypothetical protein